MWAHEKREYNNPCEGAKRERGKGKGDERPQLEISENGRTAILFWVTNVAFLSAALVIVCHTCCHTCGFTMRTTPPPPPSLPLFPPMLNGNAELNPSTRRHNNKKRFTRLNVGKLTTRSVSGFAERHNTHMLTHSHTRTPLLPHSGTQKPQHTQTDWSQKIFIVLGMEFWLIHFALGILKDLYHKLLSMTNCQSFKNLRNLPHANNNPYLSLVSYIKWKWLYTQISSRPFPVFV